MFLTKNKINTLLIVFVSLIAITVIWRSCESDFAKYYRTFDSDIWKNWQENETEYRLRWEMIGSLTFKHRLKGKNKEDIIKLLGTPDNHSFNTLSYNLGMTGFGIDAGVLHIKFDENQICKYYKAVGH